ncbi:hypothetical protein mflW37_0120 [Mesoplasma florum W37]|uniref:HTH rpiR-type domain-containing protein n=1 Tax=Mesoplasma florum TaxID=2151 RepID=A0AAD0HRR7_MESFO|nr:hypothetical protein [Mesoplasma florum]AGY41079.1 hypothetical protein mflW37_0120 [Mesoplasma florum W37]AVN59313.1 hypothetical protein CG008_00060 [Mesoplasma florum]AVN65417.1 hypothetical protein MflW12_0120 [Mesoplasma florum]
MNSVYKNIENLSKDNRETAFKIVAKQILLDFSNNKFRSQEELAKKCYVSNATITQFSKAALCTGYRELRLRLKIEYDNNFLNDQKLSMKKISISEYYVSFENWLSENWNFLEELIKTMIERKQVFLFPSFQTHYSAIFLSDVLEKHDLNVNIFNLEKDLKKLQNIDWTKKVVLLILTGRDNESLKLIYDYMKKANSKVFVICSQNWNFKDDKNVNIMYLDNQISSRNYVDRNFWLINLYKFLEEILIKRCD